MKPIEYLDVLDERGNLTGKTASYDNCHRLGLTHRAVHVWIVNAQKEILIQKRSKTRRAHPGCWDISAAGHVSAGQSKIDAAIRETKEEIGVRISPADLTYIGTLERHSVINQGTYINNEFQDVYVVRKDVPISEIKLLDGEVEAVKYLTIEEFKNWVAGKGEEMVRHKEEYEKLLDFLSKNDGWAGEHSRF